MRPIYKNLKEYISNLQLEKKVEIPPSKIIHYHSNYNYDTKHTRVTHPKGYVITNVSKGKGFARFMYLAYRTAGKRCGLKVELLPDAYDMAGRLTSGYAIVITNNNESDWQLGLREFYKLAYKNHAYKKSIKIMKKYLM